MARNAGIINQIPVFSPVDDLRSAMARKRKKRLFVFLFGAVSRSGPGMGVVPGERASGLLWFGARVSFPGASGSGI